MTARATLHELRKLLGDADARALLKGLGGTDIYVPENENAKAERIRKRLSPEGFKAMVSKFPGERLVLPRADAFVREPLIMKAATGQISQAQVALMLQCDQRSVARWVAAYKERQIKARQLSFSETVLVNAPSHQRQGKSEVSK